MTIKDYMSKLKETDVYSLVMFAMFKMNELPEYSTLSELSYILDKDNLLKLCEYFGGMTITIPTIDDIEKMVYALLLYQWVNIEGKEYEVAFDALSQKHIPHLRDIRDMYIKLCEILRDYTFELRG